MKSKQTLEEFYKQHGKENLELSRFKVYNREEFACNKISLSSNRRDFYKITIITKGTGVISYGDKSIRIDNPSILFFNPFIPYAWEPTSQIQTGYFCLFTEDFVSTVLKSESLSQSSLFKVGGNHVFFPGDDSIRLLNGIFENMLHEMQSAYPNKYDVLRSYVQIIMHEAIKLQPPETFYQPSNASERISTLFLELLEKQFPIDSSNHVLRFKNANEFAAQINVHTNHLNRALKEITGKTTTEWIAQRVIKEAKALLQYSDWNIAEIAYCLGFEHLSNFNIFFKKLTEVTPNEFRKRVVSIS